MPLPRLIAFLRAINVGGHVVTMARLREEFEALGLRDVETFIASGNVIFTPRTAGAASLEKTIEARLQQSLGYEVATFVRTVADVAAVAGYAPFSPKQLRGAASLNVGFLDRPLDAARIGTLMAFTTDIDLFHTRGREIYWLCRKGQGESMFSNAKFEKAASVRATFRGIKTVTRLAARYGSS